MTYYHCKVHMFVCNEDDRRQGTIHYCQKKLLFLDAEWSYRNLVTKAYGSGDEYGSGTSGTHILQHPVWYENATMGIPHPWYFSLSPPIFSILTFYERNIGCIHYHLSHLLVTWTFSISYLFPQGARIGFPLGEHLVGQPILRQQSSITLWFMYVTCISHHSLLFQ